MKHCDFRPSGTVSCPICMDGYSEVSKPSCVFSTSGFQTASVGEFHERIFSLGGIWHIHCAVTPGLVHSLSHVCVSGECASSPWALQPSAVDPAFPALPCMFPVLV